PILVLKGCYCQDWSKDLILEDLHVIGATEDGGLDVVAVFESCDLVDSTTDECLRAFFWAGLEVRGDLIHLLDRCLRTHHGLSIERVADLDGLDARDGESPEVFGAVFVNQRAGRTGTPFALLPREHRKALDAIFHDAVIFLPAVLPAARSPPTTHLQGHCDDALASVFVAPLAHSGG